MKIEFMVNAAVTVIVLAGSCCIKGDVYVLVVVAVDKVLVKVLVAVAVVRPIVTG